MFAPLFLLVLFAGFSDTPQPRAAAPSGAPRVLRAGPGGSFTDPAAAIAKAAIGDTVRVSAGTYIGSLVIAKRIVLTGDTGAVIDGGGSGSIITLAADSIVFSGFTVRNGGRSLDRDDAAIKLIKCTGCRVSNNRIEESTHGIYLVETTAAVIADNEIAGDSLRAEARRGNGIHLFNSGRNTLSGNSVRNTRDGIYFSFSNMNRVLANAVTQTRYGLHYMYSDDNLFEGNQFRRNAAGAAIMFSKRLIFRSNTFEEHIGYRAYGVLLQTSEGVIAEGNRIQGNLVGIFFDNSVKNLFRANIVTGNGTGVDMLTSAENNIFTDNVITNNRTAVRTARGGGINSWAHEGRGNYWGDRRIFDLDGDGIGDRPYRVGDSFSTMAALRPVLEIFSGTAASTALSWAEDAFPVFGLPRIEDPSPLVRLPAWTRQ